MSYPFFTEFKAMLLGLLLSVIIILSYMILADNKLSYTMFTIVFTVLCVFNTLFALVIYRLFYAKSKVLTIEFWEQVQCEYRAKENSDFLCEGSMSFNNIWSNNNSEKKRIKKLAKLFISHYYHELRSYWVVNIVDLKGRLFVSLLCKSDGRPELYSERKIREMFIKWCIYYFTYHKYNP